VESLRIVAEVSEAEVAGLAEGSAVSPCGVIVVPAETLAPRTDFALLPDRAIRRAVGALVELGLVVGSGPAAPARPRLIARLNPRRTALRAHACLGDGIDLRDPMAELGRLRPRNEIALPELLVVVLDAVAASSRGLLASGRPTLGIVD
jgi:hypothetical protein